MISVKGGTQTWSSAPQEAAFAKDPTQNLSAGEKQQYFEGQDIGEVLNKVADPNWVNPDKKVRGTGNSQLDKDSFLKLLLTQMKNQDPTSPLKSHEMAAQLAQFTSLEKMTNIDDSINALRKAQTPSQNFDSLSLIGKAVSGDSAKISRTPDDKEHAIRFNLANDALKTKLDIKNEAGEVVRTLELNNLKSGKNEISWNGQLEDGTAAKPGDYKVSVDARGSNGAKVWAETNFDGLIDGVQFTAQGPILLIGKQQVRLSDINKIFDPNTIAQQSTVPLQVKQPVAAPAAVNKPTVKEENKPKTVSSPGLMDDIAMSRGLINNLNKEGVKTGG